jgi:hypothetical protein
MSFGDTITKSTGNVDYAHNMVMSGIASKQQKMAEWYKEYWEHGAGDYAYGEEAPKALMAKAKQNPYFAKKTLQKRGYYLNPETGKYQKRTWQADDGAVSYMDLESAQNAANMELIPAQTELQKMLIGEQKAALEGFSPIREKLFSETLAGVDTNAAANRAQADVEHAYGLAGQSMKNEAFRSGMDPNSGAFMNAKKNMLLAKSKGLAGARTSARTDAENTNFNRLLSTSGLMSGMGG